LGKLSGHINGIFHGAFLRIYDDRRNEFNEMHPLVKNNGL
jgi:hypothetical protein